MLSYNGEVVKTYYYSTSCGSTTDVTLWGNTTENYPYFVAECVGGVDRGLTLTVESEFNTFIKVKMKLIMITTAPCTDGAWRNLLKR